MYSNCTCSCAYVVLVLSERLDGTGTSTSLLACTSEVLPCNILHKRMIPPYFEATAPAARQRLHPRERPRRRSAPSSPVTRDAFLRSLSTRRPTHSTPCWISGHFCAGAVPPSRWPSVHRREGRYRRGRQNQSRRYRGSRRHRHIPRYCRRPRECRRNRERNGPRKVVQLSCAAFLHTRERGCSVPAPPETLRALTPFLPRARRSWTVVVR